jgi:fructose-bisphosphate aldolase class I
VDPPPIRGSGPVLRAWAGDDRNHDAAQAALRHRASLNGAARHGTYRPDLEEPQA